MKLPVKVGDKTFYMDSEEWEKERQWRKEIEQSFPPKISKGLSKQ